jgi:hypothetical protein
VILPVDRKKYKKKETKGDTKGEWREAKTEKERKSKIIRKIEN